MTAENMLDSYSNKASEPENQTHRTPQNKVAIATNLEILLAMLRMLVATSHK
jgi:hypothetical protein